MRARKPRTPGDPFATALRRLRWPVVAAWILAVVLLYGLSSSLSHVTNDGASAFLPASAASTKVVLLQQAAAHTAGQPETNAAIVVFATDTGRLTPAHRAVIAAARTAVAQLAGHVRGLAAPGALQPSADGKAAAFTVDITGPAGSDAADRDAVNAIRAAIAAPASRAPAGLADAVTGPAAVNADTSAGNQQTVLLLTALIIVAVILLLVYRSPIVWLLPLAGAVAAIIVAQASAHGLANAGFTVSTLSADILIVLVFGAASDYALLLVHRYREELRHHAAPEGAMAAALRTTLPTLSASAATVTCAMLFLLTADSAALHGLGPVGAVGIAAALLAQATFLPALLLVAGRAAFWPRIPREGAAGREQSRLWAGIGTRIARHPAATALMLIAALGAASAGLARLRIDNNPIDNVKGHPASVTGQHLLDAHFPAGAANPLVLLAPPRQAGAAAAAAHATPGVADVLPGAPVQGYDSYAVTVSADPFGPAGTTAVVGLRQRLSRDAPGALAGGNPAIAYDQTQTAGRDDALLIPLVLAVIALLLQAILAPAVLVLTTALSFAASFGLASLLWRYGFGYAGVQAVIPIYIFIFLVALGVDYNIFLSARIREESRRLGLRAGTLRGLGVTGGVITAAGVVLAGTFAALTQIPGVNITEVGTAVALGVLLDTLVVRTVLVPASLLSIGERIWWPARGRRDGQGADLTLAGEGANLVVHYLKGETAVTLITSTDRTVPVTVQTRSTLGPEDAFRLNVPIDLSVVFKGWGPFPGVRGVKNQTGAWDAAGQTRNPDLTGGSTASERLTEYTPPSSFAYEVTGFTNALRRLIAGVRGEWTFTPDGDGTLIRWTYEFKPRPRRMFLLRRIVAPLWKHYMQAGVEGSARAAERIHCTEVEAQP